MIDLDRSLDLDHALEQCVASDERPSSVEPPMKLATTAYLPSRSTLALGIKRLVDLLVAAVGALVSVPLMAGIAAAIKSTSSGPVLFKQQRIGRHGECFTLLKFRTMREGTHERLLEDSAERQRYVANGFKLDPDDPHITSLGRMLRRTSLDELPQFLNVLAGDMSVVGIRPLLAEELALRSADDVKCYVSMRPGMTGLWQVEGRSRVAHGERVELDRRYVERWSLLEDLKIMARTPLAVLRVWRAH